MKKLVFIILFIIALLTVSCTVDYTDLNLLKGTTWRCAYFNNYSAYSIMEYKEFKFISTDSVEEWNKIKHNPAKKRQTMFYSLKRDTISLFLKGADPKIPLPILVINKRIMNYSYRGYVFTFSPIRKYIFY